MPKDNAVVCAAQELRKFELVCSHHDDLILWNCPVCGRSVVHVMLTVDDYKIWKVENALNYSSFREHTCPPIECGETWWSGSRVRQ
jgi:hypothetical protein